MKFHSTCFLAIFALAPQAMAETWVGRCTDGQGFHYSQVKDGKGIVYVTAIKKNGEPKVWPLATLQQSFYNEYAICGSERGTGKSKDGYAVSQFCMNKSRKTIYLKYKHPDGALPFEGAVLCKADIQINK